MERRVERSRMPPMFVEMGQAFIGPLLVKDQSDVKVSTGEWITINPLMCIYRAPQHIQKGVKMSLTDRTLKSG